jgi:hypothetical protein
MGLRKEITNWAWWCMPIIPGLAKLRQEDLEFEVSLSYTARPCLKTWKK